MLVYFGSKLITFLKNELRQSTYQIILIEKAAEMWNMLQHHQKNAEGTVLEQNLSHRISSIEQRLMDRLENSLIEALSEENNGMIKS